MIAFIDTSIFIDVLRGRRSSLEFLENIRRAGQLHSSEVVRAEILIGMRPDETSATERLFQAVTWHEVDEPVSRIAGEMGRIWKRSHSHIETADLLIAASSVHLDAQLFTRNIKHFPMFDGLFIPY